MTRRRRVALAGIALAAVSGGLTPSPPAGALEPGADCTTVNQTDSQPLDDSDPSQPVEDLQIDDVHQLLRDRGESLGGGARVAVVDSGIAATVPANLTPIEPVFKSAIKGDDTFLYYQGSAVAGLVGGAPKGENTIGVAPDAEIVDVQVYDSGPEDSGDAKPLTPENLVAGLQQIADGDAGEDIDIVTVALAVPDSPELKQVIDELTGQGIIVVASAGNRPASSDLPFGNLFGTEPEPGEDAANVIFPAGYADPRKNPLVVSVTSTASGDESSLILPNSRTTVAAPSADAATYAVNETACRLVIPSTVSATAEVSGVLALLRTAFKNDSPKQLVARLEDTAAGSASDDTGVRGRTIGFGVVQPLEALTRIVDPSKKGKVDRNVVPEQRPTPVVVDPPAPDELRSTRRNAVWWGLGGGGALVIALLLRPVIARRRPS